MHLPNFSAYSYDSLVATVLGLLGAPVVVISLVTSAFVLKSWIDGVRGVHNLAKKASGAFRRRIRQPDDPQPQGSQYGGAGPRVSQPRTSHPGLVIFVSALAAVSQLMLLGLCYLAGNFCSAILGAFFPGFRASPNNLLVGEGIVSPWHLLSSPGTVLSALRLDIISGPYLLLCVVCVVASYFMAFPDTAGKVMAMPAVAASCVFAAIGGIKTVAGLGVAVLGSQSVPLSAIFRDLEPWVFIAVYSLLYYKACIACALASRVAIESWVPAARGEPDYGGR